MAAEAHRKKYSKGPDVGSKSEGTRFRYKDLLKDKRTLDSLSDDSSTARGDGCPHTAWDSQERPHSGRQWAVHKQKGHRCPSRTAMMHLNAVLNGS